MLDELKAVDGWIDEGTLLPAGLLNSMKDPLVKKVAAVVAQSRAILDVLHTLNAFTGDEMTAKTAGPAPATPGELPHTRTALRNSFYDFYYGETILVKFYAAEMCRCNGYTPDAKSFYFDSYSGDYFHDANLEQIAAFCRLTGA